MSSDHFPKLRRAALEWLSARESTLPESLGKVVGAYIETLASPNTHSFLLPQNGLTLAPDTASRLTLENCKLPFPSCVLEYSIDPAYWNNPREGAAFFPSDTLLIVTQLEDRIRCTAVWRQRNDPIIGEVWTPSMYGFDLDAESEIIVQEDLDIVINKVSSSSAPGAPYCPSDEILANYADEMRVLSYFVLLCNCGNVKAEKIYTPSAKLVKRARERGKLPPDDYYVLDCFLGEPRARRDSQGIHHASPRFHVRRGHVRRLPTGKLTWVRSTTVGDASLGHIDKDYRMHGPRR